MSESSSTHEEALTKIDAYVEKVRAARQIPGISLAIVHGGSILAARGYGVRDINAPAPVDAQTLFAIASNTKAFTAAALAILVDEGRISWDDPVIKHLHDFQMYDPYVTREITIRDLLTHRSGLGLGQGDLLVFPRSTFTPEQIVHKQRYLKPKTSFRSRYAYDNLLYLVASQTIPAVTGVRWEEFVRERIFAPLGMTFSTTGVGGFQPGDNVATSHSRVDGKVQPVRRSDMHNAAPAGAINSNAADMARWLLTQLNGGAIPADEDAEPRTLFSAKQNAEMWSPQTIIPTDGLSATSTVPRSNFTCYGLGWRLTDYQGHKLVWHTGGLSGMVSRVTMIPDLKVGFSVLTNQEDSIAYQAITYFLLDHFLGLPEIDWMPAFLAVRDEEHAKAAEVEVRQNASRTTDTHPSLPLAKYAGVYIDDWYGTATIKYNDERLTLLFDATPSLFGGLEHYQYDTFIARWNDRSMDADAFVTFSLKPDGSIDEMKMLPVSPLTDFSFDFQDLLFKPATPAA